MATNSGIEDALREKTIATRGIVRRIVVYAARDRRPREFCGARWGVRREDREKGRDGGSAEEDRQRGGVGRFPTCTTRLSGGRGKLLREEGSQMDSGR